MARQFRSEIAEGMIVRSADGEKLGKVVVCEALTFQVEKGFFFPKEFTVKYEEITDMHCGEIILARGRWALLSGRSRRRRAPRRRRRSASRGTKRRPGRAERSSLHRGERPDIDGLPGPALEIGLGHLLRIAPPCEQQRAGPGAEARALRGELPPAVLEDHPGLIALPFELPGDPRAAHRDDGSASSGSGRRPEVLR
jgi:hypothetical protein